MRLRNDSKLDFKTLPTDEEERAKRIVEHLNLFIEDVGRVLSGIDITNFTTSQRKTLSLRSGQETIVAPQGFTAIVLESSASLDEIQITTKSTGVIVKVVTPDAVDTTVTFWVLKL